jgi:hypothetical protein
MGPSDPPIGSAMNLAAPTLLAHGSADLKGRLLRRILTGEDHWCQLFSEPGNGSDLAGLQTRADRDGDEWVVNGQKVWTSYAHLADIGEIICRTDPDAPKHKGLTGFVVDMRAPGVEVRPLRQMTGGSSFNEVFFTDVRIPDSHRLGDVNQGWSVALTTLAHERGLGGVEAGRERRLAEGAHGDRGDGRGRRAFPHLRVGIPSGPGRADLLATMARQVDASPVERQLIADVIARNRVANWNVRAGPLGTGGRPGTGARGFGGQARRGATSRGGPPMRTGPWPERLGC